MTTAFAAHLRLLASLPARTHHWEPQELRPGRRWHPEGTRRLHGEILSLFSQGLSRQKIALRLGISAPTVGKHINGKIKLTGEISKCKD